MTFRGWPVEAIEFYEGLEADNSKTYWQQHQHIYEQAALAPMEELLAELKEEFGPGTVFRPYRDLRFSADKSPYKTTIAARLAKGGFVQLSTEGLDVTSGYRRMSPDQLERYRKSVADDRTGSRLEAIVRTARKAGMEVGGPMLRMAPKGYQKDHPRIELLRHKGLSVWRQWPAGAWLGTRAARGRVEKVLRAGRPLIGWLGDYVGQSDSPRAR